MKDFYLHLPSNAKHTGNTPREFIVLLAHPYELVGEWEVGLMEIQCARTWFNVPSDQFVQVGNTGLGASPPITNEFNTIEATQKTRLKIARNDSSEDLPPDLYLSKRLSDILYKWLFSRGINFRYIRE